MLGSENALDTDYFDGLSERYDEDFSFTRCGRWLRQLVRDRMDEYIPPNGRILEIGCGTGEDALYFASRGCEVTASDASPAMLDKVREKSSASPYARKIKCLAWNLNGETPPEIAVGEPFDTVFSNFGAFNCVELDSDLAARLAACTKSHGHMGIVAMSRFCPWEIIWFGLRGARHNALRRLQTKDASNAGITVHYPSHRQLADTLKPYFRLVALYGIGILLPPSFAFHTVDRWPNLFAHFFAWEYRLAHLWPFSRLNDHYLAVFERLP